MIDTYYTVRCDRCGRAPDISATEQKALEYAEQNGWLLNVDDNAIDLCWPCGRELKAAPAKQSSGSSQAGESRG